MVMLYLRLSQVGSEPLTFINVSTNRGTFKLTLERKDFYASSAPQDTTQPASTEHNSLYTAVELLYVRTMQVVMCVIVVAAVHLRMDLVSSVPKSLVRDVCSHMLPFLVLKGFLQIMCNLVLTPPMSLILI